MVQAWVDRFKPKTKLNLSKKWLMTSKRFKRGLHTCSKRLILIVSNNKHWSSGHKYLNKAQNLCYKAIHFKMKIRQIIPNTQTHQFIEMFSPRHLKLRWQMKDLVDFSSLLKVFHDQQWTSVILHFDLSTKMKVNQQRCQR